MPKATLEFDLPEEQVEFDAAQRGSALQAQVSEFDNWLRGVIKYTEWSEADAAREVWQTIRDKLHELVQVD
jgi:hypothetical protein